MAKIVVGKEYKEEFFAICELYSGGFLSSDVNIKRADGKDGEIVTAANTFVYSDNESGVSSHRGGGENELRFDKNGASWFAQIRGDEFDSSSSDFEQLIADVASDYHKYYSLIEFKQSVNDRLKSAGGSLPSVIKRVEKEFLRRVFGYEFVVPDMYSVEPENYYAVSMRLEISGGAESEPLLGKVYFRTDRNGGFTPITREVAKDVDDYIKSAVPSDDKHGERGNELVDGTLMGNVLNEVDKLLSRDDTADYIMFNDPNKIKGMLALLATSDEKELECTRVTVLGVSHVEWQNLAYSVVLGGKTVMKLVIGLNNGISLYCTNCSDGGVALVDNNSIVFETDEYECKLDFESTNFGISDYDISLIRQNATLGFHIMSVSCPDNPRNKGCKRIVCSAQTAEYDSVDGKTERKCKGCPYPEVIYRDVFDDSCADGKFTRLLNLDEQSCSLTDEPTVVCKSCKRMFVKEKSGALLCKLCADTEVTDESKKLYKKYAQMLAPNVRIKHIFSVKSCREDSNMIVFRMGGERYIFDKLAAREFGLIDQPKKV